MSAMTLVSTVTVGAGGAANIEWTNIPQTGKDLLILTSLRGTSGANARILPNNNSSNHTWLRLFGTGSSTGRSGPNANASNLQDIPNNPTSTANTFSNNSIYISNYTAAAAKSMLVDSVQENNATAAFQVISAITWNNTAAITSLVLQLDSNNFVQNSSASLYIIS